MRVGILGCGNIAEFIAAEYDAGDIVAFYGRHPERCQKLAAKVGATVCGSVEEFLESDFDYLVEAASPQAVREHLLPALRAGKHAIVLSVAAFADADFYQSVAREATKLERIVRIPSGALFGLDNLKVGQVSEIRLLKLRTTKPPASLGVEVRERTCLFRGGAFACSQAYPRNVNVAVAVALAGGREPEMELWADPDAERIEHLLILEGAFGRAEIRVHNEPSPHNPRTSYLAALSILALLRGETEAVRIGT
ncbi:MAG: aspartate dehydrogenase [Gammaproteobacteria bacterium]